MTRKRTRFVPLGGVLVPIVGMVGEGGRVTLFDTPAARRLAGPEKTPWRATPAS